MYLRLNLTVAIVIYSMILEEAYLINVNRNLQVQRAITFKLCNLPCLLGDLLHVRNTSLWLFSNH